MQRMQIIPTPQWQRALARESLQTVLQAVGVRGTPNLEQLTGKDNAAAVFSDEHTGEISPVETNTQRQHFSMRDLPKGSAKGSARPKKGSRRVSPAPGSETMDLSDSRPNSNNSNSNVSDAVGLPDVSETESRDLGYARPRWRKHRSKKHGTSTKQRSSSGGSEDSKDSVFSETGSRKRWSGIRQDSNSSTSLSSLMNAWEGGNGDLQSTDLWLCDFIVIPYSSLHCFLTIVICKDNL